MDLDQLVEPDRVHRRCYTDPEIFELEMRNIFERIWVYCGHESQVPNAGDYYAVTIGRQPMVMVRNRRRQHPRALQPLPAPRRAGLRQPEGQHRQRLRLLVPRLELPPRRQGARDPAASRATTARA